MLTDDDDSIMETSSQYSISSTNLSNTTISDSTIPQYRGKSWTHPYPPTNQSGPVLPHDLPYFEFGRTDRKTIAKLKQFCLPSFEDQVELDKNKNSSDKIDSRTFAISCWSNVPKEVVLNGIIEQFGLDRISYVCVANEYESDKPIARLHIQILLLKQPKSKGIKKSFLTKYLSCGCEYKVTRSDRAWNEYLKKGFDFIEHQSFESPQNTPIDLQWRQPRVFRHKNKEITDELAADVLKKIETSTEDGLLHLVKSVPADSLKCLTRRRKNIEQLNHMENLKKAKSEKYNKEFCWKETFPHCTEKLRNVTDEWVDNDFRKCDRARCFVLVGLTGTGKTTFAESLYGVANYCRGSWSADHWNNEADYMVFEDIPWDDFERPRYNYPNKRDLLSCQKTMLTARKENGKKVLINTQMPAIVLLNPGQAGSLLTKTNADDVDHWATRALVYVMGPNEYFHPPTPIVSLPGNNLVTPPHMIEHAEYRRRWRECHEQKLTRQREIDVNETASTLVTKVTDTMEAEATTLMLSRTTAAFTLLQELQNETTQQLLLPTTTTSAIATPIYHELSEELLNIETTLNQLKDFLALSIKINASNQVEVITIE